MAKQNKPEQIVGIDIGSNALKLVCVSENKIIKTVTEFLPEELVYDEKRYMADAMPDFIKTTATNNDIPLCDAAIILPANQVYVRNVTLPAMTEGQLKYNLPFEFRDYLIEENNKYYFDYAVEEITYDEENKPVDMKLFICAALKQTVEEYRAMLKKAGFRLQCVVPAEYAISVGLKNLHFEEQIAENNEEMEESAPETQNAKYYCVADIAYGKTNLFFYYNAEYRFTSTIDFGMGDIERNVAGIYDVDLTKARSYMLSNNDNVLESEQCRESYSAFAVEVMKMINYFGYNNREATLDDLYLCGGGAAIADIADAIQVATNLSVHSVHDLLVSDMEIEDPWNYLRAYGSAARE